MNRLTQKRVNGIKTGYWSASKKDELVTRLAEYEDTGLNPEEVLRLKKNAVQWIPVTERVPERNESVLLCMKSRSSRTGMCIQTGSYDNGFWFIQGAAGYESLATFEFYVLAWMPLPEPYREV